MERYEIGTKFKSLNRDETGILEGTVVESITFEERDAKIGGYTYWGICGLGIDHIWVEKGFVEIVS
ncbi:hypothetical protein [Pseudomonas phage vB_PseuGesM_254]|uniref:YopX protein domain-containing protein n=1 Tax=Pseudomonas phage vB_PseuGesM_254 TaxID=3092638 RepID=A0AAX4G6C4_9CAUD|nr:hypothetical protein [Pseudomonas phage PseuGes_254]